MWCYHARLKGQSEGVGTKRESGVGALRDVSPYVSVSGTNLASEVLLFAIFLFDPATSPVSKMPIQQWRAREPKENSSISILPAICMDTMEMA